MSKNPHLLADRVEQPTYWTARSSPRGLSPGLPRPSLATNTPLSPTFLFIVSLCTFFRAGASSIDQTHDEVADDAFPDEIVDDSEEESGSEVEDEIVEECE
jgi:hypothetical protein